MQEAPGQIMMLDSFADVTSEMAEEVFEISCNMRPE